MESLRAFGAVFSNRSLRQLQLAGIGSTLGLWAYSVGLAVYAYDAGGARAVGLIYAVRWGTAALCAPWLSLIPDRRSRQRVMVVTDLSRVALLGGMTALAAFGAPAFPVYALAVLSSIVSTMFQPAQGALLPSLVGTPEELTAANAVMNTVSSVGMFAGPAIGGILLAVSGPAAVFGVTAGTFLWSALCVLRIPKDEPPKPAEPEPVASALLGGFRAIAAEPALRVVIGLTSAQTVVAGAFEVLLVVVAFRLLDAGSSAVGWLNAAIGVGALLGVVAVAALAGRKRLAGDVGLGLLLWGLPIALVAVWSNFAFVLVLFAIVGLGNTLVDVAGMTLLQRSANDEVLGRVFGVLESLILATIAIGSLVAPGLVSLFGAKAALIVTGAFLPTLLVPLWPMLRRVDEFAHVPTEPLELLRATSIFAPLPPTVLERLASLATEVRVPALTPVFEQGDAGDRFYLIAGGEATVEVDDVETSTLARGDFFGEIALLHDVPRTATVRAAVDGAVWALDQEEFLATVTGQPQAKRAAHAISAERLRGLAQRDEPSA